MYTYSINMMKIKINVSLFIVYFIFLPTSQFEACAQKAMHIVCVFTLSKNFIYFRPFEPFKHV